MITIIQLVVVLLLVALFIDVLVTILNKMKHKKNCSVCKDDAKTVCADSLK